MERYDQQFGNLGPMVKSDNGFWVKNEDAENILHWNEQSLYDVIKERNEEIARYQEEMLQMQQDVQNYADGCEEDVLEQRKLNAKLFSLLVISTTINLFGIGLIILNVIDAL